MSCEHEKNGCVAKYLQAIIASVHQSMSISHAQTVDSALVPYRDKKICRCANSDLQARRERRRAGALGSGTCFF
jgi:hypothetical protein